MISSANVGGLPEKDQLRKICKAISLLDAILCPEWDFRYYSYNSHWDEHEEVFEMRDGEGDHILILFRPEGCVINGISTEFNFPDKDKITSGLPDIFREFIFGEPVKTYGTSFCIWTDENGKWQSNAGNEEDGSADLLFIFDGKPETYIQWAEDYFETDIPKGPVDAIYRGEPLNEKTVLEIDPEFNDWEQLQQDIEDIDYIFENQK